MYIKYFLLLKYRKIKERLLTPPFLRCFTVVTPLLLPYIHTVFTLFFYFRFWCPSFV